MQTRHIAIRNGQRGRQDARRRTGISGSQRKSSHLQCECAIRNYISSSAATIHTFKHQVRFKSGEREREKMIHYLCHRFTQTPAFPSFLSLDALRNRNTHPNSDSTMESLSDGHTVAPLIKVGYLHSRRGAKTYLFHFGYQTKDSEYPQVCWIHSRCR